MKKIFKKIDHKSEASGTSKEPCNYLGKTFVVGKITVTVEDILAEGEWLLYIYF